MVLHHVPQDASLSILDVFGAGRAVLQECLDKQVRQSAGGFVRLPDGASTVPVSCSAGDADLTDTTVVALSTTDSANERQALLAALTAGRGRE